MAKGERAFWSSLPGVLTGLAGILTAGFGLFGLAVNQGWIGDGGAGNDGGPGTEVVRISVDRESLELNAVPFRAEVGSVTVTNEGNEPITLSAEVTGGGESSFVANDGDCTRSAIPSGGSCEVEITFDAGVGDYQATLVVSAAEDDDQVQEVELSGRSFDPLP